MSRTIPNPGTYKAKLNGPISIYETANLAIAAAIPVMLVGAEVAWSGKTTQTIQKSDGTIQTRTIDNLKEIFGWDGLDVGWLMDTDLSECEFEIVGEHEEYTPEGGEPRMTFKIQWMNPPGGGAGGTKIPEPMDRKALMNRLGSKLRALSGGKSVAPKTAPKEKPTESDNDGGNVDDSNPELMPQEEKKPSGPPKKGTPPAKGGKTAGGQARTATMDEVWATFEKKKAKLSEDERGEFWYAEIERLFPGKEAGDLTIQNWGQMATVVEAYK